MRTHAGLPVNWIMSVCGHVAILPGSNKSAKDHGEHCDFNRRSVSLSVNGTEMGCSHQNLSLAGARTFLLNGAEET